MAESRSSSDGVGEVIVGTEGYSNCVNKIYDLKGSVIWEYESPKNEKEDKKNQEGSSAYVQEHIDLVTAIRTNKYVNEAEQTAISTLAAIMGREAAYTGKKITWDEIMNSELKLGPSEYIMDAVDMEFNVPVPGTPIKVS